MKEVSKYRERGIPRTQLAMILTLAGVLRLWRLGTESLWIDEGYSLRDATHLHLISMVRPVYYWMLHFWMKLGHSDMWLRLPSAIFGILSVLMLYIVGKKLLGEQIGLMAALLMAIAPLHVNHSQEVRMYSLTTFSALLLVLTFLRYRGSGRPRDLALCLVTGLVSFLIYPLTAILMVVFTCALLAQVKGQRRSIRMWLFACLAIVTAILPLRHKIANAFNTFSGQWSWGVPKPGLMSVVRLIRDFSLWQIPDHYHRLVMLGDLYGAAMIVLLIVGAMAGLKKERWGTSFAVAWLTVPIIIVGGISHLFANIWMVRYMIYASPAYYILLSLGMTSFKPRVSKWVVSLVVLSISLRLATYYARPHHPQWRPAIAYIQQRLIPGDAIGVFSYGNKHIFDHYYSGTAPFVGLGPKLVSRENVKGWTDRRIGAMIRTVPESKRIWFAIYDQEFVGEEELKNYLVRHYPILDKREFHRVTVYLIPTSPRATRRFAQ